MCMMWKNSLHFIQCNLCAFKSNKYNLYASKIWMMACVGSEYVCLCICVYMVWVYCVGIHTFLRIYPIKAKCIADKNFGQIIMFQHSSQLNP